MCARQQIIITASYHQSTALVQLIYIIMSKLKNNCQSNDALRWLVVGGFVGALTTLYYLLPAYYWNQQLISHLIHFQNPAQLSIRSASGHRRFIILYWTSFFESKDFLVGTGSKPFSFCDDEIIASGGCLTTTDRGFLNDSDAVVFHGRDLHVNDLPPAGWRRPHQHFIFFLLESPIHTNLDLLRQPPFRNYFNRTMTYRRDSDVLNLYGRLVCNRFSPCVDLPSIGRRDPFDPDADGDAMTSSRLIPPIDLTEKNRTVAWFVSNCQTNSRRESLVRNLSQFIAVDVYGSCGNGSHRCPNRSECDHMLSRYYRFYLSFENSLCLDYVTEKLYRPLSHNTVPVVYGGSNYSFYLPQGSYIDARHYKSPEALANYLNHLMINDTLYSSYFRWKGKYTVRSQPAGEWCPLCRFLRDVTGSQENKTYDDIAEWWSGQSANQTCQVPPLSLA